MTKKARTNNNKKKFFQNSDEKNRKNTKKHINIKKNKKKINIKNMQGGFDFGMDDDDFFGGPMMNPGHGFGDIFSEFSRMQNMMHQMIGRDFGPQGQFQNNPNQRSSSLTMPRDGGNVFTSSYCSKVSYNNGGPQKEVYKAQTYGQMGKDGHWIKEKREAYKNSAGDERVSQARAMDGKGYKYTRQRNQVTGKPMEENKVYRGLEENEVEGFNNNFNNYRRSLGAIGSGNRGANQYNRLPEGGRQRPPQGSLPMGLPQGQPQSYQQPQQPQQQFNNQNQRNYHPHQRANYNPGNYQRKY